MMWHPRTIQKAHPISLPLCRVGAIVFLIFGLAHGLVSCQTAQKKSAISSQRELKPSPVDPLLKAVSKNDQQRIDQILASQVDVNQTNAKGLTPLLLAAYRGQVDTVQKLIQSGANVDYLGTGNTSALLNASFGKTPAHQKVMQILIQQGANPNIADRNGLTPLMALAYNNQASMIRFLVRSKADVNYTDRDNSTALHAACAKNSILAAETLADLGADLEIRDRNNLTPLFIAVLSKRPEIAEMLIQRGANTSIQLPSGYSLLQAAESQSAENQAMAKLAQLIRKSRKDPN